MKNKSKLSRTWTRARYENRIHWRIKDVLSKNIDFTMWPKVSIYPADLCYTILKKPSNLAHIDFFVNFTSDGVELYVDGC